MRGQNQSGSCSGRDRAGAGQAGQVRGQDSCQHAQLEQVRSGPKEGFFTISGHLLLTTVSMVTTCHRGKEGEGGGECKGISSEGLGEDEKAGYHSAKCATLAQESEK